MTKPDQLTPIQELYKGKTIFITGGIILFFWHVFDNEFYAKADSQEDILQ